jgi:lipoyl(octanoyl) transferase
MIEYLFLGRVPYDEALRIQAEVAALRLAGHIDNTLLLLEHPPVLTLGRNASRANILASDELLSSRGVTLHEINRGGDVTYHGPGQLVGYPIFDLRGFPSNDGKRKTLGVIEYVRRLEEVLIRTCADFGIEAKRIPGLTGVWTIPQPLSSRAQSRDLLLPEAKVAALGVHISRGVTSHGFALNVNTDLSYFNLIIPCGISSKPVTSLSKELSNDIPLQDVVNSVSRNFGQVFSSQMLWLESLDALLGETVGVPMRVPAELRRMRGEEDISLA